MQKEKILITDDSEMNRSILADMLGEEYEILEAEDGIEALAILKKEKDIALVLLDIIMPRLDGFGVLEVMNQNNRILDVPVIMISAETGSQQVARAYDLGVSDFIPRPFDALIVRRRVVNTLLLYAKQKRLTTMVEEQIMETERRSSMMIEILSQIVEFRNNENSMHIPNVRLITRLLLRALTKKTDRYHLSSADISRISISSALHDIGKIAIDEKILNKPSRLTKEEFEIIKTHTIKGAEMLNTLPIYRNDPLIHTGYEICRWHHERYDGNGYPDGLKGDAIPISAQVVALADVYEALASRRVYKPALPHETVIKMILDGECGSFNPLLLQCLTENADLIRKELESGKSRLIISQQEIQNIVNESLHTLHSGASDRTLRLLDYERMKYNFFSAMTKEIQFEYTLSPPVLSISTWGAKLLNIDEIITNPRKDKRLRAVLGEDGWSLMSEKLRLTTPESPDINYDCLLTYNGETRWHRIYLRTIWSSDKPPKFEGMLGKTADIHNTHVKMADLEKKATRDPLTNLLNRAAAMDKIIARMKSRPGSHYALAIIDLDFFKMANDTYGHQFGDEVLKEIARRLLQSVRSSDICCRAGGDEFLLFLEYNTDIGPTIDRIFHSLCGPYKNFNISVTVGVALAENVGYSYGALFNAADAALYSAKRNGRGQYIFYDAPAGSQFFAVPEPVHGK